MAKWAERQGCMPCCPKVLQDRTKPKIRREANIPVRRNTTLLVMQGIVWFRTADRGIDRP